MKKYAMYLPQFHEIPENNAWWGKGFTEWTNVKKAKPLYKGHKQPKVPYNKNYYCLDHKETLAWQAEIAQRYNIDGMVFYHYYFCGKLLLEKPAEMLLRSAEIPMQYFFCWANHSWYRSWEGSKTILMEQTYGNIEDWKKHFEYLLPFFKDARYEKKDNKPVFMIFKPFFEEKKEMFVYFNQRCIEAGFDGIFLVETCTDYKVSVLERMACEKTEYSKVIYIREPDAALSELKKTLPFAFFRGVSKTCRILKTRNSAPIQRIKGDWLYEIMLKKNTDHNVFRGAFFEWDNTARHSDRGFVIEPVSKNTFFAYMDSRENDEYLFINAWNEWCEGMILEPTEENGFQYLEWIREWSAHENRIHGI